MLFKVNQIIDLRQHSLTQPLLAVIQTRAYFWSKKEVKEELPSATIEVEPLPALPEEKVMKIRDKSRLPEAVRNEMLGINPPPLKYFHQFRADTARKRLAIYGDNSGLNPGIAWPRKEELEFIKGFENTFYPSLQELVAKVSAKREEEENYRINRENEIRENLKKLPKMKAEFWSKYKSSFESKELEKQKKEKLIQEVREFVGYDLDPRDPRFDAALLKKQEEDNKVLRAQRKQQRAKEALERLQTLATEAMEREKEEAEALEKSKTDDQNKTENS